jgi:hypothetical protein
MGDARHARNLMLTIMLIISSGEMVGGSKKAAKRAGK